MANLESTDVTVTLSSRDKDIGRGRLNKNISIATVTFGDGSKTYPAGGVPMPSIGNFGFQRAIDFAVPMVSTPDIYLYKFDITNHKLVMYDAGTSSENAAEYSGDPAERSVKLFLVGE